MLSSLPVDQIIYWSVVLFTGFPALAFLACAFIGARSSNKPGGRGEKAFAQTLQAAGYETLDDFIVYSADGTPTQIDHAVKLPGGIAVVETKDWQGLFHYPKARLSGSWISLQDDDPGPAFDGSNPFIQNEVHCRAVSEVAGDVPVWNIVAMMNDGCGFSEAPDELDVQVNGDPAGRRAARPPANGEWHLPNTEWPVAWEADELRQRFKDLSGRRADGIDEAWSRLTSEARTDRAARAEHAEHVLGGEDVDAKEKRMSVVVLVGAAIIYGLGATAFWAFQWGMI